VAVAEWRNLIAPRVRCCTGTVNAARTANLQSAVLIRTSWTQRSPWFNSIPLIDLKSFFTCPSAPSRTAAMASWSVAKIRVSPVAAVMPCRTAGTG
jgi:hypothetical protein